MVKQLKDNTHTNKKTQAIKKEDDLKLKVLKKILLDGEIIRKLGTVVNEADVTDYGKATVAQKITSKYKPYTL
jgi:hypothetical protein